MDDKVSKKFGKPPEKEDKLGERFGMAPKKEEPKPAMKMMAEHTVAAGETLSDISLKYYKSAVKDKYMKIYEANKATIGDNPNMIKPGMVLKIPELS
jgi:nucleoid-associated protein YgaU